MQSSGLWAPFTRGGRHTPIPKGYQPQFFFRTTDVIGVLTLPDGVNSGMPGDTIAVSVQLQNPIAMEAGKRFAIREGGKTVGAGVVLKILMWTAGEGAGLHPPLTLRLLAAAVGN